MAAQIKDALDQETTLIAGSGGEFELEVNGQLLYSKRRTGRFPQAEEILSSMRDLG